MALDEILAQLDRQEEEAERRYNELKRRLQKVGGDDGRPNRPAWRILDHLFKRADITREELARLLVIALWDDAAPAPGYVKSDWQQLQFVVEGHCRATRPKS